MDKSLVKIINDYLVNKPVKRGFVFGSTAIGKNNIDSDLDILLEIDYDKNVSLMDFIGWKFDLEKLTQKKVDLIAEDAVSKYIRPFIENNKSLIYGR